MKLSDDYYASFTTTTTTVDVEVLQLPVDGQPSPGVLAELIEELEVDEDRTVVPVRVFWVPAGLPTRSKVVALISGRDTYRPPEVLQRRILKRDPTRARASPVNPPRSPNSVSSGTTTPWPRTRAISRISSSAARYSRSSASSTGCWAPSTSRPGW